MQLSVARVYQQNVHNVHNVPTHMCPATCVCVCVCMYRISVPAGMEQIGVVTRQKRQDGWLRVLVACSCMCNRTISSFLFNPLVSRGGPVDVGVGVALAAGV